MIVALYSDLHAHPYNNGTLLEHGTNSRVQDAVSVIRQVYSYAVEHDLDYVFFGGDLFDRRKAIDVDTYNKIHEVVQECSRSVTTIMIPGNHDQANKSGTIHALERFQSDSCTVVSEPGWHCLIDDVWLFAVPYYDDGVLIAQYVTEGLKRKPEGKRHLLLIHYGVEGARIGPSDYVLPCELKLPMLCPEEWDVIFSGHYHIGQQLGDNFHYIGSAMQHRWDDVGFEKTFVVYDAKDGSMERVPTAAPQFMEVRKSLRGKDVSNCFVRVIRKNPIKEDKKEEIEKRLKEEGAISVEFRIESDEEVSDASERISFSESGGDYQILDDYLKSDLINTSKFDSGKLLQLGKDILSQALEKT